MSGYCERCGTLWRDHGTACPVKPLIFTSTAGHTEEIVKASVPNIMELLKENKRLRDIVKRAEDILRDLRNGPINTSDYDQTAPEIDALLADIAKEGP